MAYERPVLERPGKVEPVAMPELAYCRRVDLDRVDVGAEQDDDRISRDEPHRHKDDERDPEHDRDHCQEPAQDVSSHDRLLTAPTSSTRSAPCTRSSGSDVR